MCVKSLLVARTVYEYVHNTAEVAVECMVLGRVSCGVRFLDFALTTVSVTVHLTETQS